MSVPPASVEALLAHSDWVRDVARALVADPARADDAAQETLAAALTRPPADASSPRAWLGTVLRRQVSRMRRSETRRSRREEAAARTEATRSTLETVARAELQERVVREVLRLAEPYRTTVLLRFFEGLPAETVAERMAVEASTVRGRQSRALAMLRERLGGADDDGRRRLALALAPLVRDPGSTGAAAPSATARVTETILMTTARKTVIAAVLLAVAGVAFISLRGDSSGVAAPPGAGDTASAPPVRGVPRSRAEDTAPAPPAAATGPVAPAAPIAPVAPADPASPRTTRVALRVVDAASGRELSAADARRILGTIDVRVRWGAATPPETPAEKLAAMIGPPDAGWTSADVRETDGRLVADCGTAPAPGATPTLVVSDAFGVPRVAATEPGRPSDGAADVATIVVAPREAGLRVRLVDGETGAALTDASVSAFAADARPRGLPRPADAGGRIELPPQGDDAGALAFWAASPTHAGRIDVEAARAAAAGGVVPDCPVFRAATVDGHAYRRDGTPASGATVLVQLHGRQFVATVGADGAFRLEGLPVGRAKPQISQMALVEDAATLAVNAVAVILRPGVTMTRDIGSPADDGPGAEVRVTLKSGGRPVPGAAVLVDGARGGRRSAVTGADGAAAATGLRAGTCTVAIVAGDLTASPAPILESSVTISLGAGETRELAFDLPDGAIRVRVLGPDGKPLAKATVRASAESEDPGRFPGFTYSSGCGGTTDADGVVVLRFLDPGAPHTVSVGSEDDDALAESVVPGPAAAPREVTLEVKAR